MFYDGLEGAYEKARLMGTFADDCAASYEFTREAQDAFAVESLKRANEDGSFTWEIAPVKVDSRKGELNIDRDEQPFKTSIEKIASLKPAFSKAGTVTAATSSSISDGAAALVMMRASTAKCLGVEAIARVVGHSTFAHEPAKFTTAPIGWAIDSCDRAKGPSGIPPPATHVAATPRRVVLGHGAPAGRGHGSMVYLYLIPDLYIRKRQRIAA